MELSFIILTWNSRKYLHDCFNSIIEKCEEENLTYEVIVIDNGSNDGSRSVFDSYAQEKPDRFRFICLQRNRGTTLPRNLGLDFAKGKYICILDSDTELGQGAFSAMLTMLDERIDVGLIAPRLVLEDGTVQNSIKKFPTFWQKLLKIPKAVFRIKVPDIDFYEDFPFEEAREVDSAISACWLFRTELLKQIGFLDEDIFYSPEDLDYSLRIRKAGKKIVYYPDFTVLHHTQQISHRKPFSKISLSHFQGLVYYFRKHGGWFTRPSAG